MDRGDSAFVRKALENQDLARQVRDAGELSDVYIAVAESQGLDFDLRAEAFRQSLDFLRGDQSAAQTDVARAIVYGQLRHTIVAFANLLDARTAFTLGKLPAPTPGVTLSASVEQLKSLWFERQSVAFSLGAYEQVCQEGPDCQASIQRLAQTVSDETNQWRLLDGYGKITEALTTEERAYDLFNTERSSNGRYRAYRASADAFRSASANYSEAARLIASVSPDYVNAGTTLNAYAVRATGRAAYADAVAARRGPDNAPPPPPPPPPPPAPPPPPPPAAPPLRNAQLAELLLESRQAQQSLSSYQAQCWANPAKPMPASARMPLFFATSRKPLPRNRWDTLREAYFGSERESVESGAVDLHFGRAIVSVPCHRKAGEVNRPPEIFSIELRDHDPANDFILEPPFLYAGQPFWLHDIGNALARSSRRELVLFIHGYNNSFADAAYRSAQLEADLGIDGATVFYSWASKHNMFRYTDDRLIAESESEAVALEKLFEALQQVGARRVYVIAHSMGNRLLTHALNELARHSSGPIARLDQVVFASADVEQSEFHDRWPDARRMISNATLYASGADRAVEAAKLFENHEQRMGDARPFPMVEPGLTTVDTTLVSEGLIGHDDFATSTLLDMKSVFWLSSPPSRRCFLKSMHRPGGLDPYWKVEDKPVASCPWEWISDALELDRLEGSASAAMRWIDTELPKLQLGDRGQALAYASLIKSILAGFDR